MTPGERMKMAREHYGLNMKDWGAIIRGSQSQISLWESGKNSIPYAVAAAYEAKKGVRADWLIDGQGEMLLREKTVLSDNEAIMLDLLGQLPDAEQKYLIGAARALIDARRNK